MSQKAAAPLAHYAGEGTRYVVCKADPKAMALRNETRTANHARVTCAYCRKAAAWAKAHERWCVGRGANCLENAGAPPAVPDAKVDSPAKDP